MLPHQTSKNTTSRSKDVILVIEDDLIIGRYLDYLLKKYNYNVIVANTAQKGLNTVNAQKISLILLDLGLPDIDGLQVIKELREQTDIPIIIVSARDRDEEKVTALDLGADDYVTKPFSAPELLARIRVSLRHHKLISLPPSSLISVGDITMDCNKHVVYLHREAIHLTPMEYDLLHLFLRNKGRVLSTKYLIEQMYGKNYGSDTQALRALMASLRRKIEETPAKPRYIQTEIGIGYRMAE